MDSLLNNIDMAYLMSSGAQVKTLPKEISAPIVEDKLDDITEAIQSKTVDTESIAKALSHLADNIKNITPQVNIDTTPIAEAMKKEDKVQSYRFSIIRNSRREIQSVVVDPANNNKGI